MMTVIVDDLASVASDCFVRPETMPFIYLRSMHPSQAIFFYQAGRASYLAEGMSSKSESLDKEGKRLVCRYGIAFDSNYRALVRFLADSCHIGMYYCQVKRRSVLLGMLCELMFLHGTVVSSVRERGFIAFRSHADALIASSAKPAVSRRLCDQQYLLHKERLHRSLERVMCFGGERAAHSRWLKIVGRLKATAQQGDRKPTESSEIYNEKSSRRLPSDGIHQAMADNKSFANFMSTSRHFQASRLAMNALYVLLDQTGVTTAERMILCSLVASTAETVLGLDPLKLIREFR